MATIQALNYSVPGGEALRAGLFDAGIFGTLTLDGVAPTGIFGSNLSTASGSILLDDVTPIPPSPPPSWYPAVGVCVEIPGTGTIGSAARAMGANSYIGIDPDNIVDPWSGGAIVYIGGQPYLVVMGGGHGDSSFNGIVKYGPLYGANSNLPSWTPFLAASAVGDVVSSATYLDGRQSSVHTYNNLVGVGDTLFSVRTDGYFQTGFSSPLGFKFTPSGQASIASYPGGAQFNAAAHYNGSIYTIGGNSAFDRLRIYNIAGNSYTSEANADIALSNYVGAAIDSTRGRLLVIGGPGGGALTESAYWNLSGFARTLNVTRPSNWIYSLEYDPDRDAFVSLQSASLTLLEASASALAAGSGATWVGRTFTGATPPAVPAQGGFGRFRYVPELKGYVLAPGLESPVYFFRSA